MVILQGLKNVIGTATILFQGIVHMLGIIVQAHADMVIHQGLENVIVLVAVQVIDVVVGPPYRLKGVIINPDIINPEVAILDVTLCQVYLILTLTLVGVVQGIDVVIPVLRATIIGLQLTTFRK